MGHFAEVDSTNRVLTVIVAEQDFIDSGAVGDPSRWIQTSYNTYRGQHLLGGTPLRGNYAGIGYTYHVELDAFLQPQPFASWVLNATTFSWDAPTPRPTDGKWYDWDEALLTWVLFIPPPVPA